MVNLATMLHLYRSFYSCRSSPSSQICKKLDWPLHRALAHGSTLFKSASGKPPCTTFMHMHCSFHANVAMVGERIVSVCGWEGGATMRSVPVTVIVLSLMSLFWSSFLILGRSIELQDSFSPFDGLLLRIGFSRRLYFY